MGKIISGFSNIGKSSFQKYRKESVYDLDTCYFNKIEGWVSIYIDCILALKEKYDYVFITTHGEVLKELEKRKIEYTLVYPKRELKEEYRLRAIQRHSSNDFVEGFFSRWDMHIDDCRKRKPTKRVELSSKEFLSDIFDSIK